MIQYLAVNMPLKQPDYPSKPQA